MDFKTELTNDFTSKIENRLKELNIILPFSVNSHIDDDGIVTFEMTFAKQPSIVDVGKICDDVCDIHLSGYVLCGAEVGLNYINIFMESGNWKDYEFPNSTDKETSDHNEAFHQKPHHLN